MSKSDDELGFISIKEESRENEVREERALLTQVEKKYNWTIDNGCWHHMIGHMHNFFEFNSCDGGIISVGNNFVYHIKGIISINIDYTIITWLYYS